VSLLEADLSNGEDMKPLRCGYYCLSFVPLIILPSCFGQFGRRAPGLVSDGIMAIVLIICLSPLISFLGIIVAALSPKGSKKGPIVATLIAALPGIIVGLLAGH
jgi:hypothetical protein